MAEKSEEILALARTVARIAARDDHKREREIFGQLTQPLCHLVSAIRQPLEERIAEQQREIEQIKKRMESSLHV